MDYDNSLLESELLEPSCTCVFFIYDETAIIFGKKIGKYSGWSSSVNICFFFFFSVKF